MKHSTYTNAIKHIALSLQKRKVDLEIKHIIIVPEKYTLLTEEAVFLHSNGAFDIEVASFNRLFQKLKGEYCLPKEGAVIILKRILQQNKLKVYEKSKNFSGYALKLYKEISGLIMNGITPKKLEGVIEKTKGALRLKLEDIKIVYEKFLNETNDIIVDRHGKLSALLDELKRSNYLKNAHVYVLNFDYTTELEEEILKLIKKSSLSFISPTISHQPSTAINTVTQIYSAANSISAIKVAAKRIRAANFDGVKFKEMAIVCGSGSYDGIRRVFNEFKIPFYIDEKPKLRDAAITKYILALMDLKMPSRSGFVALAKNAVSKIELDDICGFENYCNKYLIEYKGFYNEFEDKTAEAVRRKLTEARDSFWDKQLNHLLDDVLDESSESVRIKELFELSLKAAVGKASDGSLHSKKETDFILDSFKENLLTGVMSGISPASDVVLVSNASAFRGTEFKKAFVLDFNEGIIPEYEKTEGVLSGLELENAGLEKAGLAVKKQESQIKDLLSFMNSAQDLFISYIQSDEIRPSPLLASLEFNRVSFNSDSRESVLLSDYLSKQSGLSEVFAFPNLYQPTPVNYIGNTSSAFEYLLLNINNHTPQPLVSEIYHLLKNEADKFLIKQDETAVENNFFDALFFFKKTISASQLEDFYRCPFRHFIRYGLKAKETKSGEVDVLDAGNLIHKIAEKFVRAGFCETALKDALKQPFGYKFELAENAAKKERLIKVIEKLALRFKSHIKAGDFKLLGIEIGLSDLQLDNLNLAGKVDYADYAIINGKKFIRIIDYKSGRAKFSKSEVEKGEKLQLALYALSFMKHGYEFGGAFYYPFKNKFNEKLSQLSGIAVKDETVLKYMDREYNGDSYVFDTESKNLLESGKIEQLLGSAKAAAEYMIKRIKSGERKAVPGSDSVCGYCEYSASCSIQNTL